MKTQMTRARLWFYMLYPPLCFYVFAYPLWRLTVWYGNGLGLNGYHVLLVWGIGVAALWYSFSGPKTVARYVVVHWMGVSFVFATLTLLVEILKLIIPITNQTWAICIVIVGTVINILAVILSHHLSVKQMIITTPKVSRPYRIAQISDVHIGSRQSGFMMRIVKRLNDLDPDVIVVTGDLVDSSAVGFSALESIKMLTAKTFFTIGNHERYSDLENILSIADRVGMHTLRQASASIEELHFIGIDDADNHNQVSLQLPNIKKVPDKFNVLLYHRPLGWESAIEHGIDLMLSGHTHNGQIFPFNLVVKRQFSRIRGLHRHKHHHLYVSSGTGTWGPLMRLGSLNEITLLHIEPEAVAAEI